jgi:uncharacterized protein with HEPN domain
MRLTSSSQGLDAVGYEENALVRAAVERQFEIIGEALNQLSKFARTLRIACLTFARSLDSAIF